jgi:glycosyltransferase involved in cell wall biosynthesis
MRILQLGPYPPPHGGVQSNLVAIREHLRRNGHECGIVNLTRHRGIEADEIYYPKSARALLKLLAALPYDILHLHIGGNLSRRLVGVCLACCWMPGKRAVLTFHSGGYPSSPAGRATHKKTLRAFAMRQFDALIAVNDEIRQWFELCGCRDINVIQPHAIGSVFAEDLRADLRAFYDSHAPVLLSVGCLEPEYDLPLQIDVMARVRECFPDAGLVMIGWGSLDAELRTLIASKPYGEHLLLTGDVPHAITMRAIAECTAYLRTTHYDGDSISVREALHLGVPVIASDNGMRPPGCRLIPGQDADALVRAIFEEVSQWKPREPKGGNGTENLDRVLDVYRQFQ